MKTRTAFLSLLTILCLLVAPAMADTLYTNGPPNGTTDAWTINSGFSVSDSFACSAACDVVGLHIGVWLFPGDAVGSVDAAFGSSAFGGSFNTYAAASHTDLGLNQYGYDLQIVDFNVPNVGLPAGTSWITLQNAVETQFGDPVYWDENSGVGCGGDGCPSQAYENSLGSIPSEAFTLTATQCCGQVPEPSSLMLFGSGILGIVGVLRRKLDR